MKGRRKIIREGIMTRRRRGRKQGKEYIKEEGNDKERKKDMNKESQKGKEMKARMIMKEKEREYQL